MLKQLDIFIKMENQTENKVEIELLTANEVVSCLWNKNAIEKCRIGIADTVVYEVGLPTRWYVTGRTGEVVKKSNANLTLISERWLKISSQQSSSIVGIMRQEGGILKFLSAVAWKSFCENTTADTSIHSIHCFVKGNNQTLYRNSFELRDNLGRFKTNTLSYMLPINTMSNDPVMLFYERDMSFTECKASSLRNIMDLATNTVLRYLETMLQIKVISLTVDYVIDTKSQLWLMWTSPVRFVRGTSLHDLNIPGIFAADKIGRTSWVGFEYARDYHEAVREGRLPSPTRKFAATTTSITGLTGPSEEEKSCGSASKSSSSKRRLPVIASLASSLPNEVTDAHDHIKATSKTASMQLSAVTASVNEFTDHATSLRDKRKLLNRDMQSSFMVVESANKDVTNEIKFPEPFKCKGHYCNVHIKSVGPLRTFPSAHEHSVEKFFSKRELETLRKDKDYGNMMEYGADGPALAAINMKSIILAKQERRDLHDDTDTQSTTWEFPLTPRQKTPGLKEILENVDRDQYPSNENSFMSSTPRLQQQEQEPSDNASSLDDMLTKDREHRYNFTKGMAVYYDQVRVCGVCYNMYQVFDWARNVLGKSDTHKSLLEAQGAGLLSVTTNDISTTSTSSVEFGSLNRNMKTSRSESGILSAAKTKRSSAIEQTQTLSSITSKSQNNNNNKPKRKTWQDYNEKSVGDDKDQPKTVASVRKNFADLDDYLRKGVTALADRKAKEKEEFMNSRVSEIVKTMTNSKEAQSNGTSGNVEPKVYRGRVLFGCEDNAHAKELIACLDEAFFDVVWARDGRQLLNELIMQASKVDCVIVDRELKLGDAFAVVKGVRDFERDERKKAAGRAAAEGKGIQPATKRYPVICFTSSTAAEDIKMYMKADMDGCVSFPVNRASLLSTVRAAVPHHMAVLKDDTVSMSKKPEEVLGSKVYKLGLMGMLEGSSDSATLAAKSLSIASSGEEDIAMHGVIQIDADTRVPYMVMDASRSAKVVLSESKPFFNLVICHDIFDTAERLKIFMRPIVERYIGMQVLLWNYPGQAFTEWREEQLLNNEFLSSCLNEVLGQVGEKGTKDFDTSRPFYVLGYGNGGSLASFYAAHYSVPNLRGIINVNAWSYVDSYLAGVMHDCINIFQCSPASRPDLPVYFFSRFLFAKDYLAKVSVPLALNIYTAVHNPITLKGRMCLCKGVLHTVDVRSILKEIDCPVIVVQSTQDSLSRPLHTEPFVTYRGGEVRSIHKALKDNFKTCVIWMKAGHEVFQECRKPMQLLIEQLLTGFHEKHDISYPPAQVVDKKSAEQGTLISSLPWEEDKKLGFTVEDKFIDNVLSKMGSMGVSASPSKTISQSSQSSLSDANARQGSPDSKSSSTMMKSTVHFSSTSTNPEAWEEYSKVVAEGHIIGSKTNTDARKLKKQQLETSKGFVPLDPTSASFGREDSVIYNAKSKMNNNNNPNIHEYSEVKEYMGWRLKRNKKRLQRLQGAARVIQGAFRAFLARKFVQNIRRHKAAAIIQRCFRGWLGKCSFLDQAKRIWATLILQKMWRGYLSRKFYFELRRRIAASANIQRIFRGHRARLYVARVKVIRNHAASLIQALARRVKARTDAWRRRHERNASVHIQRIYRGHLGRRKAIAERDKFIFSKSQSQGIEFGRQMLLEHKLHATKLQSDVTLLSQEKVGAEEQVEALLEEISSFEEGVRVLEKEMHMLSKVEAEAAGFIDEDSRFELREQKIKLDKEFGQMLTKISNRKDMLTDLEKKLGTIDRTRQSKEEELRTLERKLVVLLEEQQNELNAIKRKQDVRGALLAASHDEIMKVTSIGSGASQSQSLTVMGGASAGGSGGGGSGGPSLQEKKQAAQLMQSTETLMKFGFMSMSMTYFSSLNMIKALRTVSAQDTVMAALADVHAQRAVGFGSESGSVPTGGSGGFLPSLKPGQFSGQEALRVSSWSVDDVSKWLQTISLGQYSEAFIDAAIDGEFLYDINDDDLKNSLGIEHRLHRKKILQCVHRLKIAESQTDNRISNLLRDSGGFEPPVLAPDVNGPPVFPNNPFQPEGGESGGGIGGPGEDRRFIDGPKVSLQELFSFVRHSKLTLLKEAVDYLPNKKFDKTLVKASYVEGFGTVYMDGYERLPFHMNKTDDYGNSLLSLSCQNGNSKICKYLVGKGCNPNHQNKTGQSPAHFAISYKFFEISHWLFENGANDTITNQHGLTPYDGLAPDDLTDETDNRTPLLTA